MRIWSIHPKYLDTKGLVALWRETLLAKHVLENKTKGYRNHPQLHRFKKIQEPLHAINYYLSIVHEEAIKRNYRFDPEKISRHFDPVKMNVTKGQVDYEIAHLKNKLRQRDPAKWKEIVVIETIEAHPLFTVVEGTTEDWEIIVLL
jgi:hypothetical protein